MHFTDVIVGYPIEFSLRKTFFALKMPLGANKGLHLVPLFPLLKGLYESGYKNSPTSKTFSHHLQVTDYLHESL